MYYLCLIEIETGNELFLSMMYNKDGTYYDHSWEDDFEEDFDYISKFSLDEIPEIYKIIDYDEKLFKTELRTVQEKMFLLMKENNDIIMISESEFLVKEFIVQNRLSDFKIETILTNSDLKGIIKYENIC